MQITVYSKSGCVQCDATTRSLTGHGLGYTVIDLASDPDALAFVTALGYRQAPIVVADDQHWSGFRPDRIAALTS